MSVHARGCFEAPQQDCSRELVGAVVGTDGLSDPALERVDEHPIELQGRVLRDHHPDARRRRTQTNAEGGQARAVRPFVDAPRPTGAAPASQATHGTTVRTVETPTPLGRAPCRQLSWRNCRSLLTDRPAGRVGDARSKSDFAVCRVGGGERDGGADAGAASWCRFDGDASADGGYAVPNIGQSDAGRHGVEVEPGAVVAHVETDAVIALGNGDADRRGSPACFAAFCSASRQQKYTAFSISAA